MNETTITVVGRLVADPVIRQTYAGSNVTTFRIATNARKNRPGTGQSSRRSDQLLQHLGVQVTRGQCGDFVASWRAGRRDRGAQVSTFDRQDGSKGSAADITARQIGHDLSWGVSGFAKVSRQAWKVGFRPAPVSDRCVCRDGQRTLRVDRPRPRDAPPCPTALWMRMGSSRRSAPRSGGAAESAA